MKLAKLLREMHEKLKDLEEEKKKIQALVQEKRLRAREATD